MFQAHTKANPIVRCDTVVRGDTAAVAAVDAVPEPEPEPETPAAELQPGPARVEIGMEKPPAWLHPITLKKSGYVDVTTVRKLSLVGCGVGATKRGLQGFWCGVGGAWGGPNALTCSVHAPPN